MFRFLFDCIFGFFTGIIRSIKGQERNRGIRSTVDDTNYHSRQVVEYSSIPIETFFNSNTPSVNTLVSGISANLRNRVICSSAWNAENGQLPVVILHCNNRSLENEISTTFRGRNNVSIINQSNSVYDPLHGLASSEVSTMVLAGSRGKFEIKNNGGAYIDAFSEYLNATGYAPNIRMFIECDHLEFPAKIRTAMANGQISRQQFERIERLLVNGQMERANVESFFKELAKQSQCVVATDNDVERVTNIQTAINNNGIIMLDMISGSNNLFLNFALQEIKDAMSAGQRFMLILDSIPMNSSESLRELLENFSGSCQLVLSADDVFAEIPNQLFDTMVARFPKVIVLRHNSGISCKKLESFFGSYLHSELTTSYSTSTSQSFGQIMPGHTAGDSISTSTRFDPRVPEQAILGMRANEAFIRDGENAEIIHINNITSGRVGQHYERPPRPLYRSNRSRFNGVIFFVLFLIFSPAAMFYAAFTLRGCLRWLMLFFGIINLILYIWLMKLYVQQVLSTGA